MVPQGLRRAGGREGEGGDSVGEEMTRGGEIQVDRVRRGYTLGTFQLREM